LTGAGDEGAIAPNSPTCILVSQSPFQPSAPAGGPLKPFLTIRLFLLIPLVLIVEAPTARAQAIASLPDAPQPQVLAKADQDGMQDQSPPARSDPNAASPIAHAPFEKRKWAQYVDPGERIPPLYPEDKWVFWLHEETRVYATFPAFLSAGYGQLTDTPDYGSDSGAFGDRLAAAFVRQATMRFFCSSLFPVVLREDPRYFRKASGDYWGRTAWAAERTFVTQKDDGGHATNYSDILGHLAASALTLAYYPQKSANVHVVMQTWGTSIAGAAGNNLFLEFAPDAFNAWRQHKRHADSSGTP
jgi:hypothetical protein